MSKRTDNYWFFLYRTSHALAVFS